MKICGKLVDIHVNDIYPAQITFAKGKIIKIEKCLEAPDLFILPGLIDAHIHIESSMITPGAFAEAAVRHGTTGVITDPHEIANVLGEEGVKFMFEDAERVPLKFYFGAPSCVPATEFETNGASLNQVEVVRLLELPEIKYLAEMMNFPGVIFKDKSVHEKLNAAIKVGKPIDGHAPGLSGDMLSKYVESGISTDHECSTLEEAREKISLGMKILIREGSAACNLNSLKGLFKENADMVMLCSDDLHPEMLRERHINKLIAMLISDGYDPYDVIRSATKNPSDHYNLKAGLLREGDDASFIIVDSLDKMNIIETWIDGKNVFADKRVRFKYIPRRIVNNFKCSPVQANEIEVKNRNNPIRVIQAFEGELLTKEMKFFPGFEEFVEPDIKQDILKIVVKDRYKDSPPAVGYINGFGIKNGAFASSVAHDSHNIIAVGTNDTDLLAAINEIVKLEGGLVVASEGTIKSLQLNIAGIMSSRSCNEVAAVYEYLNEMVKNLGCPMKAPFMTLSFMALLVIPDLKIGDKGLFDVKKFELVSLFI